MRSWASRRRNAVRLEQLDGGGWIEVAASATDADGRCRDLAAHAPAGDYRLNFSTGSYLQRQGRTSIYPEIIPLPSRATVMATIICRSCSATTVTPLIEDRDKRGS